MINGQLNAVSMQSVTLETAVPAAVMTDGIQQSGGNFAEMLSGIKSLAMPTSLPDSGQAEPLSLVAGTENPVIDLLAGLFVLPQRLPMLETVETKMGEVSEKTEVSDVTATQITEPIVLAPQIAMLLSAYAQPDRISDVNNLTTLPGDTIQEVASVSEQSAVISASPVMKQPEQVPAELTENGSQQVRSDRMPDVNKLTTPAVDTLQKIALVSVQPAVISAPLVMKQPELVPAELTENESLQAKSDRMSDVSKLTTPTVDTLQKVAVVSEQQVVISAPPVMKQPEKMAVELQCPATENGSQPAITDRMSDVNSLTDLSADTLQKVVVVSEQPVIVSASTDKIKVEQVDAELVKASVASVPELDKLVVAQDASADKRRSLTALLPAQSPESELEIQLSQPQPITARLSTTAVLAENRSAALVQEQRSALKQFSPDQQIEKIRAENELNNAKEVEPALKTAESASESALGSGTSQGGEGNQGQTGGASDNQMLAQNMRTQMGSEHQKVSGISAKAASVEPVIQDIPEQVMHQVKERLVQHDVKPGSQQITLTLSPDSLGELKMNLNLQGQKLSVEIMTENRTVRDIIVQHTDALKESLARQNITMESFDVTTGGKGSGNQGQNQNAWRELAKQQQQHQSWTTQSGYQVARADLSFGQTGYQKQQGQSMLDIHY